MIRLTERRADTIYGLSEKSAEFRSTWKLRIAAGLFLLFGLITMGISYNQFYTPIQRIAMIALSFGKYLFLLFAIYSAAKTKAAKYVDDIYELKDISLAEGFIENVAFGGGDELITINEGKISEKDERSPIILIGGPGYVKVNLGSAALLEQIDGSPHIISANREPWKLNRFERIREIGGDDQVGKREYATINLQDQFVNIPEVKSRTKDGISIEAHDIKIMFSIMRDATSRDPYSFNRKAAEDLVYKQKLITPKPDKTYGVSFPWDMAVIPLIQDEMERLISSKTLSEILSSISQKELNQITEQEAGNTQLQAEITGQLTQASTKEKLRLRNFQSRSQITDRFFEEGFKKEAVKAGIDLHWIDVGTWHLPSNKILESLKSAWALAQENKGTKLDIENSAQKRELEKLLVLIQDTIINPFETTSSKNIDYDELILLRYLEKAQQSEVNKQSANRYRMPESKDKKPKSANAKAIEVLKTFLKEFLMALDLIEKERTPQVIKNQELYRINHVIEYIQEFLPAKSHK